MQKEGFAPENIILLGDSAGGNLVVTTMLKLLENSQALPGAGICISPWLNLAKPKSGSFYYNEATDLLPLTLYNKAVSSYLGEAFEVERDNPLVSPICSERLHELPPLFITAGTSEALLDQATDFCSIATHQGNQQIYLRPIPNEIHCSLLSAPWGGVTSGLIMQEMMGWLARIFPSDTHRSTLARNPVHRFLHDSFTCEAPHTNIFNFHEHGNDVASNPDVREFAAIYKRDIEGIQSIPRPL